MNRKLSIEDLLLLSRSFPRPQKFGEQIMFMYPRAHYVKIVPNDIADMSTVRAGVAIAIRESECHAQCGRPETLRWLLCDYNVVL